MKFKHTLIALASSTLFISGIAQAADTASTTAAPSAKAAASAATAKAAASANAAASAAKAAAPATANRADRRMAMSSDMKADREQLQQKLRAGKSRADYEKIVKDNGYRISAINEDKKDYLEYEVVKGVTSFEVQIDFKDGAAQASNVKVANNMWPADATQRMAQDEKYQQTGALVVDPSGRYSDRRNMKGWTDEKTALEKALPLNLKAADYRAKIEGMGYKVTNVNDRDKDYVEYEIAKGVNSYEVQIDLNEATGTATKVDVTNNLWEASATDDATDRAKDMTK